MIGWSSGDAFGGLSCPIWSAVLQCGARLLIHTLNYGTVLTHGYLMDSDVPDVAPHCELCNNALLSVKHIMVECEQLRDARRACLGMCRNNRIPNMRDLLGRNIKICEIVNFLRNIGAYNLI